MEHDKPATTSPASAGGPVSAPRHAVTDQDFRLMVESIADYAIFMLDPSGCVRTWNLGAERIKGYLPEEILGQLISVFFPP